MLYRLRSALARVLVSALLTLTIASGTPAAAEEKVLYTFTVGSDGYFPQSALILDNAGNLYGTTPGGGAYREGNVFELTSSGSGWTETILYSFTGSNDGYGPTGPLVWGENGNLFGVTVRGGALNAGTVFELSPTSGGGWTESTLYAFSGGSDGGQPVGLIPDGKGNLYGITNNGGDASCNCGVVFELKHSKGSWTEIVLRSFLGLPDGTGPIGLAFDNAGNLYGTTLLGGAYNAGTVFQMKHLGRHWNERIVHSFTAGADGYLPLAGVIVDQTGNLYGTTNEGGGGGCQNGCGLAFELKHMSNGKWKELVLHRFSDNGHEGIYPSAGLIFDNKGNLYGTTWEGGTYGNGTAFELMQNFDGTWVYSVIETFIDRSRGSMPNALVLGQDGYLYGSTYNGGAYDVGLVFQLSP
jgi:uncharacterized repeat protein (TIGR03803 family)